MNCTHLNFFAWYSIKNEYSTTIISRSDTGGLWLCWVVLGSRDSFELLLRENKAFRGRNDSQFYPPLFEVGLSY